MIGIDEICNDVQLYDVICVQYTVDSITHYRSIVCRVLDDFKAAHIIEMVPIPSEIVEYSVKPSYFEKLI